MSIRISKAEASAAFQGIDPVKDDGRTGIAWKKRDVNEFLSYFWYHGIIGLAEQRGQIEDEATMADAEERLNAAAEVVESAYKRFAKERELLKSSLKNDIASVSAAVAKVEAETNKIRVAAERTITVLTSHEMKLAIENAERLATALRAITELQPHRLTFAVLDSAAAAKP